MSLVRYPYWALDGTMGRMLKEVEESEGTEREGEEADSDDEASMTEVLADGVSGARSPSLA